MSRKLVRLFNYLTFVISLATISLLNFSLAFISAIFYVPALILANTEFQNRFLKAIRMIVTLIACPLVYYSILYGIYLFHYEKRNVLLNTKEFYDELSNKLYYLVLMAKLSNVWTVYFVNLCLIPIWASSWFIQFDSNN